MFVTLTFKVCITFGDRVHYYTTSYSRSHIVTASIIFDGCHFFVFFVLAVGIGIQFLGYPDKMPRGQNATDKMPRV